MTFDKILPSSTPIVALAFAAGMTFALPASAGEKGAKAGTTAASCMEQAQKTERAVESLGPESPGHKETLKAKVHQAQGECAEGQFANARQLLGDVQAQLRAKGVSTDVTERKGALPGGTAATGSATAGGSAAGAKGMASAKERADYCMQRAQRTENVIESLGPESPSGKTLMQSRVEQAQGFCMEGQVAEANDILMDLEQSLKGKGVSTGRTLDTTGTKSK